MTVAAGQPSFTTAFPAVLDFWFGDLSDGVAMPEDSIHVQRWFTKNPAIDADIRSRYEKLLAEVTTAVRDGWQPDGLAEALAAIIVLDQFPRNMYRDTPRMYETDPQALALSQHASAHPGALTMDLFHAKFLFMPLMHSEDREDQALMHRLFIAISDRAEAIGSPCLAHFKNALMFAARHREIVDRFGRFPHRNAILGRATTVEEAAFLKEERSSF